MSASDIMWIGMAAQLLIAIRAVRRRQWFEVVSLLALAAVMALFALDQGAERGNLMLSLAIIGVLGLLGQIIWDWRRRRRERRVGSR